LFTRSRQNCNNYNYEKTKTKIKKYITHNALYFNVSNVTSL